MKCRHKLIKYCQEWCQSYLSDPQLLSDQKIKSVYEKLLRNQSVVSMLKTGHQLFQTFSICILNWLLRVLHVFTFPFMYEYKVMPPSSPGWWNGQQPLMANEMWAPVTLAPSSWQFFLLTLPLNCCLAGQTTIFKKQKLKCSLYETLSTFHTNHQQNTNGECLCLKLGSLLWCITWKPCVEEELCWILLLPSCL